MTEAAGVVLGDWGTSRLRLFLAQGANVQDRCEGPGIGALVASPIDTLQVALQALRGRAPPRRVVLCGMAGSRNGLIDVPYVPTPAAAEDWICHPGRLTVDGLDITIAAGLRANQADGAPDVMRGEETQVFGALQIEPALAAGRHLIVLPGTHSKWVRLRDGRIHSFKTYITGELYGVLREHSTLLRAGGARDAAGREPVAAPPDAEAAAAEAGFVDGLRRSRHCGSGVAAAAFEARSGQLLSGRSRTWAAEFLSGLLIGAEVHAALQQSAQTTRVSLIGEPRLTARYRAALAYCELQAEEIDGDDCVLAGLRRLADATQGVDHAHR